MLELRDLKRALARLPVERRLVVLLVGWEGMDYAKVASLLALPLGTVRSRLSRGRAKLRQLTGYGAFATQARAAAAPGAGMIQINARAWAGRQIFALDQSGSGSE